jgi:hypothetical protein
VYRIDTADAAAVPDPIPPSFPEERYWTEGNPGGGEPATITRPWWFNMVQEEIRQAVVDAGLTPDKTDNTQLAAAIAVGHWVLVSSAVMDFEQLTGMTSTVSTGDLWVEFTQSAGIGSCTVAKLSNIEGRGRDLDRISWVGGMDALAGAETLQVAVGAFHGGAPVAVAGDTYDAATGALAFGVHDLTILTQVDLEPGDRLGWVFIASGLGAASGRSFRVSHIGYKLV